MKMQSEKQATKILFKCLDEMYKHSTPRITWKQYVKKYYDTGVAGCEKHKISEKNYNRIYEKYRKKMHHRWHNAFGMGLLYYAPSCATAEVELENGTDRCKDKKNVGN